MKKILVINSGSSSLKFQLIDMATETMLAKGLCDRIGINDSFLKYTVQGRDSIIINKVMPDHRTALKEAIFALTCKETGVISDVSEIFAVGHRVVHGGERFHDSVIIDEEVMETIKECIKLAPLHNPPNITGIKACQDIMPGIPMVAVFDTAFHQSMPRYAYLYALPYELYTGYGIRKYGFHGTSHKYVARRAAAMLNRPLEELRLISCHLGNGASICAIKNGKSVDTSMGFTPLDGLAMGTRSGTIDPAVVIFLMERKKMTTDEVYEYLNKKSGVLSISGVSSDFRDIQAAASEGNERARLAIDVFCYRVKKYIGEYSAVLGGIDGIIFTAGIGENNDLVREKTLEGLEYLGIKIDKEKNSIARGRELDISVGDAKEKVLVIPTNEELEIARETLKLVGAK
ncbi:MAG: acetate kinase [Clostridiaceae bacterium]|nr:acetate kinase [Clostridiaceae bacterium]